MRGSTKGLKERTKKRELKEGQRVKLDKVTETPDREDRRGDSVQTRQNICQ